MAATNPLTFNDFVTQLANLAVVAVQTVGSVVQGVDTAFTNLIPTALNYAEERIQRDCDLNQALTSAAYTLTAGNNVLAVPVGDFISVRTLSVAGTPLLPVSQEVLQTVYGTNANSAQPIWFAPYGGDSTGAGNVSTNFLLGPWPDSNYPVAVTGTTRLPSLYKYANATDAGTKTTFISTWLPDLLLQASMILVSQFQRNFGAGGNDPEMPGSYETQYQNLLKGALVEEARRKFQASAWSAASPPLVATPAR